jgi:hypothetical protein
MTAGLIRWTVLVAAIVVTPIAAFAQEAVLTGTICVIARC